MGNGGFARRAAAVAALAAVSLSFVGCSAPGARRAPQGAAPRPPAATSVERPSPKLPVDATPAAEAPTSAAKVAVAGPRDEGPVELTRVLYLDETDLSLGTTGWGVIRARRSVEGNPLTIGGARYERGVGTHAKGEFRVLLDGRARRFTARVGVDDEMAAGKGSVEFVVRVDGETAFRSGTMRSGDAAREVDVDLSGAKRLVLLADAAGDGNGSDHADWADARFTLAGSDPVPVEPYAPIPPYLQRPAPDGMTVCFLSKDAEQVTVSWSTEGGAARDEAAAGTGIRGTAWTMWRARLTGLKPGAAYTYSVGTRGRGGQTEAGPHTFRTIDPGAPVFRAALFNDIHNREATLEALMKHVRPEQYDLSILLGDVWADPQLKDRGGKALGTLSACVRHLNGSEKPMLLIRGNHEVRGDFAPHLAHLFDLPNLRSSDGEFDQRWHFSMTAGPVWFVALDGGEDFLKRYRQFQPMRRRQADWLDGLVAGREGEGRWRVLLTHMPLHNSNIWNSEPCRQEWEPILARGGIDLALAGHDHTWRYLERGREVTIKRSEDQARSQDPQGRTALTFTVPWPTIIGGGPALEGDGAGTVMLLEATREHLDLRLVGIGQGRELEHIRLEERRGLPAGD